MRTPAAHSTRVKVTAKQRLLRELIESREGVLSAIRGLGAAEAERPIGPGKWSVREIVLHLAFWDHEATEALDVVLRGVPPRWEKNTAAADARMNAEGQVRLGHFGWDGAVGTLRAGRAVLLAALERIPSDPEEVWTSGHVFGSMLLDLPSHDRHHAAQIRRFREEMGTS